MVCACANFTRPPELPTRKAATERERPLRNCDRTDLESEDRQTREEELGGGGGAGARIDSFEVGITGSALP